MEFSAPFLRTLLETYGYPAIFIGSIIKGETVLILAGMLSFLGYLDLHWVIPAAFLGSFGGDQFFSIWAGIEDQPFYTDTRNGCPPWNGFTGSSNVTMMPLSWDSGSWSAFV
jgi:hypothetical protein